METGLQALDLLASQNPKIVGRCWLSCWKVDGCVFAIYNVGMMDHAVGVQQLRLTDDLYHVVRFTRDGPNSTLQVDDLPVQYKRPTGN